MEVLLAIFIAIAVWFFVWFWRRLGSRVVVGEHSGVQIRHQLRTRVLGRNTQHWTEYLVDLPAPLDSLNIIEGDAHVLRAEFAPHTQLPTVGSPGTPSDVFNGLFEFTAHPTPQASRVLQQSSEVRDLLRQLTELYRGTWVADGTLRVLNHVYGDAETLDIDRETLASFVLQIEDTIAQLRDSTVLDFAHDVDSRASRLQRRSTPVQID